ncbi:MAG: ATP-binding protein [Leptospira sp.]|nr:ATP-binding protein [Leptospira sp.]
MEPNFKDVIESFERRKSFLPDRIRPLFADLIPESPRSVLLYGLRGVGKSTFLIQRAIDEDCVYCSADSFHASKTPLYDLVKKIFQEGYAGVMIDEIHFASDWSRQLKSLYDDFPKKKIWVSDSCNLLVHQSLADLSRRFVPYRLPLLSFREFIYLKEGILFDKLDPENPSPKFQKDIAKHPILAWFREFVTQGTRPIFQEGEYPRRIQGLIDKTIYSDLPFYLGTISDNHLRIIKSILAEFIFSPIPTINISGMCSEWGLSKDKLYQILHIMEESELIRILRKKSDNRPNSKGSKILLTDPSVYHSLGGNIGTAREAYFCAYVESHSPKNNFNKTEIFASSNEKEFDFEVDEKTYEIGGRNKKPKNAEIVVRDDLDIKVRNSIPMFYYGFGY